MSESQSTSELFSSWSPRNQGWGIYKFTGWNNLKYTGEEFKTIFEQEPVEGDNVEGLIKAGNIIKSISKISLPTQMSQEECELIYHSGRRLAEQDPSNGYGIVMYMGMILNKNPQCLKCWAEQDIQLHSFNIKTPFDD